MGVRVKKLEVEKTAADKREINVVFSYIAFHFIVDGYGYFNGKRLGAGEGFVCEVGQLCNYYPDKTDPWEYIWVIVEDGTAQVCAKYRDSGYTFTFDSCDGLRTLCLELSKNPARLADSRYSEAVFTLLESYTSGFRPKSDESTPELIERAVSYMNEHIFEREAISDIAGALHISEGYLRYLFKLHKGLSPKQYLDLLRAERASALLTKTDYRIEHIAASVGFDDAQAFSKFFKKHHAVSPKEFRRKSREM